MITIFYRKIPKNTENKAKIKAKTVNNSPTLCGNHLCYLGMIVFYLKLIVPVSASIESTIASDSS